jgi:hypothetical protein
MATRIAVALEDDLDGGAADETLQFRIGGADYEIDLSKKHAKTLRRDLAPFIDHARKAGRRSTARPAVARGNSSDVRAWARAQGIAISDRGRIPSNVIEQYQAAVR